MLIAALLHDAVEDHPAELAGLPAGQPCAPWRPTPPWPNWPAGSTRGSPSWSASVTNPEYDPDRDRNEQYRSHVAESLDRDPWARVIKVSDFTDNGVGVIHTTLDKARSSATKYRPLVPTLRELIGRPDTPLSTAAKEPHPRSAGPGRGTVRRHPRRLT